MNYISALAVPLILALSATFALHRKVDVFSALVRGGRTGLGVTLKILPPLVMLLSAVYMLRASGAMEALSAFLSPLFELIGIPVETAPLILVRPISGSGALAVGSELISEYGVDSLVGRTAAVMLGSTETTFYTIAVYFGAVGVKKTRYAVPAALCADLAGFLAASITVRLMFFS